MSSGTAGFLTSTASSIGGGDSSRTGGRAGGQVGGRAERGREGTLGRAVVNEILVDEPGPARFGFPPGSHFENHLPTEPNYVAGEEFN